ncbi:hypothetical protein FKP32DRAFT_972236 [Trametes sanguinea]|nr:hypothetical protein FKP32DRAFT_972236 [Trametes sanguinea]
MALVRTGEAGPSAAGTSEFDILKSSHKFLREDDDVDERLLPWDERLAKKYYSSLYREYAVCDLKHYKSGNFALRWRTEEEVLSGAGETTCGNTRCPLHKEVLEEDVDIRPALTTLEVPFSYLEHGESKFALEKERARKRDERAGSSTHADQDDEKSDQRQRRHHSRDGSSDEEEDRRKRKERHQSKEHHRHDERDPGRKRKRSSRSRSPRR